jgi:hypothetical protein
MTVDGVGQSESTGPFAWDRLTRTQPEVWVAGEYFDLFAASHDGYAGRGVLHRRWVFHAPGRFWLVRDVAEGQGTHELEIAWHLGAGLLPAEREGRFFAGSGPECGLEIVGCTGDLWQRKSSPSWWSPVYGGRDESWVLRASARTELPAECATVLVPLSSRHQSGGSLRSLPAIDAADVRGYIYEVGQEKHGFFFRQKRGPWMHAGWASDAEFVYYRASPEGLRDLYFYNGSYVEAGGRRVVSARGAVSYCQLVTHGDATRVVSPASDQIVLHQPLSQAALGRDVALSGARDRTGR